MPSDLQYDDIKPSEEGELETIHQELKITLKALEDALEKRTGADLERLVHDIKAPLARITSTYVMYESPKALEMLNEFVGLMQEGRLEKLKPGFFEGFLEEHEGLLPG